MKSLLKATSQVKLNQIFSDLEKSDEDEILGILLNFQNFILRFLFIFFICRVPARSELDFQG